MPRKPRLFIEGAIFHVFNRAAHGLQVFAEDGAGEKFVEILSEVLRVDGHLVYAWMLLGNHYHVVLRSSAVSLARTFGRVQSSFGRWRNRTLRTGGPTWQGRYKAKLVEDESYLMQLIAYVHLNPVAAGMVRDPAEHELSGHREVLGLCNHGLIATEEVLSLYGDTKQTARSNYSAAIGAFAVSEDWLASLPGFLPWWGLDPDPDLQPAEIVPARPADGRPSRDPRPKLEAGAFLGAACETLGMQLAELESRTRSWSVSRPRIMVAGLGIERWNQSAKALAERLDRYPELVSWWARRAAELRRSEAEFAAAYEKLDEAMRHRFE